MIFADTGYWTALWNPRDALHHKALALSASHEHTAVITTEMVLVETLNAVAGKGSYRRQVAIDMLRRIERTPNIEIIPQTPAQFRTALERYTARADQTWSLTDCASFLVMEDRHITEALAYDQDFEQAGFIALLRADQR